MEKIKSLKLINITKCVLISVLISLGLILGFAIILKFTTFNDFVIKIINQIIKIVSIFLGVFTCLKYEKEKCFFKGLIIGLMYTIVAYFAFSLLNTKLTFGLSNIIDFAFNGVFGAICGIFCANYKSKDMI